MYRRRNVSGSVAYAVCCRGGMARSKLVSVDLRGQARHRRREVQRPSVNDQRVEPLHPEREEEGRWNISMHTEHGSSEEQDGHTAR